MVFVLILLGNFNYNWTGTCIFVHGEGSYQYCLSLLLLDTLITGISLRVSSFTCASPCVSTKAGDQTNNVSAHGGAKELLSEQNIENQSVKTLNYQCMPQGSALLMKLEYP